jgi:hypothetical protein
LNEHVSAILDLAVEKRVHGVDLVLLLGITLAGIAEAQVQCCPACRRHAIYLFTDVRRRALQRADPSEVSAIEREVEAEHREEEMARAEVEATCATSTVQ